MVRRKCIRFKTVRGKRRCDKFSGVRSHSRKLKSFDREFKKLNKLRQRGKISFSEWSYRVGQLEKKSKTS